MSDIRKSGKRGNKPGGPGSIRPGKRRGVHPQEQPLGSLTIVTPAEDMDETAEQVRVEYVSQLDEAAEPIRPAAAESGIDRVATAISGVRPDAERGGDGQGADGARRKQNGMAAQQPAN